MNTEIWKDIKGYEGLYQVSNFGRIKSLSRTMNNRFGGEAQLKERIRKLYKYQGYFRVALCKNCIQKSYNVHRLVAQAFIPNPDNLPIINHKDENPSNNHVENLEWCTHQYNNCYGTVRERLSKAQLNCPSKSKTVYQYDLHYNLIKVWPSAAECRRSGFSQGHICACCRGERKTHKGFHWSY